MNTAAIETKELCIGYRLKGGRTQIVHDHLNLHLVSGEVTCLLGLNGRGEVHVTPDALRLPTRTQRRNPLAGTTACSLFTNRICTNRRRRADRKDSRGRG